MSNESISSIYKKIQNNIAIVESGNFNRENLNAIEDSFYKLMDGIKLYLISNKSTYYGTFFLNLTFEVNFEVETIAGIKLNTYPPVFVSNPLLLCKFSIKEIMFVVCHEIEHIILRHPLEMVKANPYKDPGIYQMFNYAADASVNDRIMNEARRMNHKFLKAPNGIVDSIAFGQIFSLGNVIPFESYIYYFNLIKDISYDDVGEAKNPKTRIMEGLNGESSNNDSLDEDPIDSLNETPEQQQNDENIVTAKNANNITDHEWEEETDLEEMDSNLREYVKQSYNQMSEKMRGTLPNYVKEEIEKCNQAPVISWQSLLKKYVGTISAKSKPTRMKLNRRQPNRFDLSGKTNDKTVKITVAVDTSGSMSSEILSFVFNEIFSILKKKNFTLNIIEFDCEIQKVYTAKKKSDVQLKVKGRGGTSFQSIIEYVNDDKKYRDNLLIIFTDGCAEFEIDKPNVYRILWVLTGRKEDLSVKEPYGMVLELNKE